MRLRVASSGVGTPPELERTVTFPLGSCEIRADLFERYNLDQRGVVTQIGAPDQSVTMLKLPGVGRGLFSDS